VKIAPDDPAAPPIKVDIDGLADFAKELRHEVEANLQPYLAALIRDYMLGAGFGYGVDSPNVAACRMYYHSCLAGTIKQLNAFAWAGAVLADTAELIATQYRNADELTHSTVEALNTAIGAAVQNNPLPTANTDTSWISINGRLAE
jgi:hypothetical protein